MFLVCFGVSVSLGVGLGASVGLGVSVPPGVGVPPGVDVGVIQFFYFQCQVSMFRQCLSRFFC